MTAFVSASLLRDGVMSDPLAGGGLGADAMLFQSFQFGDLLFEGLRFSEHGVLLHVEHRNRLYSDAKRIRLPLPPESDYDRLVFDAARRSGLKAGYIRLFALRDFTGWGVDCRMQGRVAPLLALAGTIKLHTTSGQHLGIRVGLSSFRRPPNESVDCTMKWGGNYLNNKRSQMEAADAGYDDAIMLSYDGFVSEAIVENVFWITGGTVFTPAADSKTNCLPGVTRAKVMSLARGMGLIVEEGHFRLEALSDADEVFLTGTGAGVLPVQEFLGKAMPMTNSQRVASAYAASMASASTPIGT